MSKDQNKNLPALAAMFQALSNEHRLSIFLRLLACCPASASPCCDEQEFSTCVGDLGRDLDIAASTVSHHIKVLRQAELVHVERDGKFVHCWVVPAAVERLRSVLGLPDASTGSCSPSSSRATQSNSASLASTGNCS